MAAGASNVARVAWGKGWIASCVGLVIIVALGSCGQSMLPAKSRMESEILRPFREAAGRSDRSAHGFGPFPTEGDVRLEEAKAEATGYDVLLHLSGGGVSREVAFAHDKSGAYRWIGEQEVHEGLREYDTEDGRHREFVAIIYAEKPMRG